MSYAVPKDKNSGPIKQGYIGFQGGHGGQWFIKNLRIDTVPSWTTRYAWPPTCAPTSIAARREISQPQVLFNKNNLTVSLPNEQILRASLVSLDGKSLFSGRINAGGSVEFTQVPRDGVYFLKYLSASGSHSIPLGLLSTL
jgi:hypothetical protein